VRIRRDRAWERARRPRHEAAIEDLLAFPALGRAALDGRLGALRAGLLRSPYYRETLGARGLGPSDLQSLDDLAAFPTLDRATLAARWREVAAFDATDELVLARSSGSTGAPVTIVRRADETLHVWAIMTTFVRRLGLRPPPRPRAVLLCGLPGAPEYSAHLPLFGDGALHRISIRRPDAAARLARVRPFLVTGDPESLRWLAERPVIEPSLIVSSALQLSADLRAALPAPIVNLYATTETGPIAWECARGRFHVLVPDVWVESLGGELVVTRLRDGALPLLRYLTGDRGEVATDDCPCGQPGPSIVGFVGRRACRFRTLAGGAVDAWQLAPLLRDLPLRAFRVTQRAGDDFLVELAGDAPRGLEIALARGLAALGFETRLEIRTGARLDGEKPEPFRSSVAASR